LTQHLPYELFFHNLKHTQQVVRGAIEIGHSMQLTSDELEIVCLAAWFHDTGHIYAYAGHERHSQMLAQEYLERHHCCVHKINRVLSCIAATIMPQSPKSQLDQIIYDADLYHLSLSVYFSFNVLQRKERNEKFN
jgi:predicted metal-dependent HD superfamily phosphohydrolase